VDGWFLINRYRLLKLLAVGSLFHLFLFRIRDKYNLLLVSNQLICLKRQPAKKCEFLLAVFFV
ncbi:MAG: hypothetical protein E7D22_13375, partial [Enterococcus faecalis]|nr:hypothetical protein [Enterococcus faecalis]